MQTTKISKINAQTKLCALIGNPVKHSMSPAMHNAAFDKLGLNIKYIALQVEENQLKQAIKGLKALNIIGLNITIPHKQKVMHHLDKVDLVAKKIGAVNTILNKNGKLHGFNTDLQGAIMSLEEHTVVKNKKVVILGAGGAARSIAFGLKQNKAKVIILNRTVKKAKKLAKQVGCSTMKLDQLDSIKADILINATSVGMHSNTDKSLATKEQLKNFEIVMDIVYNPLETKLIRLAKQAGCTTITGLKMLVLQAAASFEIWTGKKPDIKLMQKVALKKLGGTK